MRDRNQAPSLLAQPASFSPHAEPLRTAESELAAFYAAVSEMYGPEEATQAALDWIQALENTDQVSGGSPSDWRPTTIAAARGLASRVVNRTNER